MGIPGFNKWFANEYDVSFLNGWNADPKPIRFDHVYVDLACILHFAVRKARSTEDFHALLHKRLDIYFRKTQPRKSITLVLNGPAPLAKLLQQRRSHVSIGRKEEKAESKRGAAALSSTALTPGTPFMLEVEASLTYYIAARLLHRHGLHFALLGSTVPGDASIKILDRLAHPNAAEVSPGDSHCVISADSDAILLAMQSAMPGLHVVTEDHAAGGQLCCFSMEELNWAWARVGPPRKIAGQEEPARVASLKADMALLCLLAGGNDYLPPVSGLGRLGPNFDLWDIYIRLRRSSRLWGSQTLVQKLGSEGPLAINASFLSGLLKRARQHHTPKPVGGSGLQLANPEKYLEGVRLVLRMYQEGRCPDYRWTYGCEGPLLPDLIRALDACTPSCSGSTPASKDRVPAAETHSADDAEGSQAWESSQPEGSPFFDLWDMLELEQASRRGQGQVGSSVACSCPEPEPAGVPCSCGGAGSAMGAAARSSDPMGRLPRSGASTSPALAPSEQHSFSAASSLLQSDSVCRGMSAHSGDDPGPSRDQPMAWPGPFTAAAVPDRAASSPERHSAASTVTAGIPTPSRRLQGSTAATEAPSRPLLPAAHALALLQRSGSRFAPRAARWLMDDPSSPVADLFRPCSFCSALYDRYQALEKELDEWKAYGKALNLPGMRSGKPDTTAAEQQPEGLSAEAVLARISEIRQLMKSNQQAAARHKQDAHADATFSVDRIEAAVASIPLSFYPVKERPLAFFGRAYTFRWQEPTIGPIVYQDYLLPPPPPAAGFPPLPERLWIVRTPVPGTEYDIPGGRPDDVEGNAVVLHRPLHRSRIQPVDNIARSFSLLLGARVVAAMDCTDEEDGEETEADQLASRTRGARPSQPLPEGSDQASRASTSGPASSWWPNRGGREGGRSHASPGNPAKNRPPPPRQLRQAERPQDGPAALGRRQLHAEQEPPWPNSQKPTRRKRPPQKPRAICRTFAPTAKAYSCSAWKPAM